MEDVPRTKLYPYGLFEEECGPQLAGSGFPVELWGVLYDKLIHDVFDAGDAFQLARYEEDDASEGAPTPACLVSLAATSCKQDVWLIDHAWTFRAKEARRALQTNDALRLRVGKMLCGADDAPLEQIYERLWHSASTYRIATETSLDEECCWYLNDEVGSAIQHVEEEASGNCRIIPLYYPPAKAALTVMWLTSDVEEGEVIAFCDALERSRCPGVLRLMHSLHANEEDGDVVEQLQTAFALFDRESSKLADETTVEVTTHADTTKMKRRRFAPGSRVVVATDLDELAQNIRSQCPRDPQAAVTYEFSPELGKADLIWLAEYQEDLPDSYPRARFVSQLGIETTLCHKERMQRMLRRVYGNPVWLPRTYDASTEMHLLCGDYLTRRQQSSGDDNLWIVKPHCMARSMDMIVTDCLPLLLRQGETGPKIICKYIADPCLFRGRKFDLRLIVAVQQLHPHPLVYLYNKVWPRFALEPYSLTDFDQYEKHWTVMNYANPEKMINLRNDDFVKEFNDAHGAASWNSSFNAIKHMIHDVFAAVSKDTPPTEATTTRGATIYGLDVMLTKDLQPMLLECTFAPDCHRACVHYPTFFADVFSTLFEGVPANFDLLSKGSVSVEYEDLRI